MAVAPEAIVNGPAATSPLHSLVASVQVVSEPDERWALGMAWLPEACASAGVWDPCPVDPDTGEAVALRDKSEPVTPSASYFSPFLIETASACGAAGWVTVDNEGRARRQLEAATSKALEHEFWCGTLRPDNFSLVRSTPNTIIDVVSVACSGSPITGGGILSSSALSPLQALTLLSQAAAYCGTGGRAVIHAPSLVVEEWAALAYLDKDGSRLVTRGRGDIVVNGSGYTGQGPAGATNAAPSATSQWVYVTGMVQVRLGAIQMIPETIAHALDRRRNDIVYRAERAAAATVDADCCTFAVRVDLTGSAGADGGGA